MDDLKNSFLSAPGWENRLRRSLLFPGTQKLEDVMPLDISEFCVEHFRNHAPSQSGKLGPRVATRLMRNTALCPSAIVAALIYLKRLKKQNPEYLRSVPSSELFIVSMMVASKYLFDEGTDEECYNDEWSTCLGIRAKELTEMELSFLKAIDWRCHIPQGDFMDALRQFEVQLALNALQKDGIFTYNTALNLELMHTLLETLKAVSKLLMISALTLLSFVSSLNHMGSHISTATTENHNASELEFQSHRNLTDGLSEKELVFDCEDPNEIKDGVEHPANILLKTNLTCKIPRRCSRYESNSEELKTSRRPYLDPFPQFTILSKKFVII